MSQITRRGWFTGVSAFFGGWLSGSNVFGWARANQSESSHLGSTFRFVHMTDLHIQPELKAAEGVAACLQHIQTLNPKPDFILTGGDLIMDALQQDEDRASKLFDLLKRVLSDNNQLPVYHCMGNHDVFGWGKKEGITAEHPRFGKKMYLEKMELERPYYSFDHKGWRFFVLDSIQPSQTQVYQGGIDDLQMDWFRHELARKPKEMPGVVVTHIPFVTVTVLPDQAKDERFQIGAASMCSGAQTMATIFSENNIKLALSGHMHMVDEVLYRGVKYVCSGAVSARWWKGPHRGFSEGYAIIDITDTGQISYQYMPFGWQAVES